MSLQSPKTEFGAQNQYGRVIYPSIGNCKSITFSRLRHPIEFSYMLGGNILDRVDSINDLGVMMDSKMSFTGHIDVTVGKALAMLGFVRRLSCEFRDPKSVLSHEAKKNILGGSKRRK
jgi:hypothetical protein